MEVLSMSKTVGAATEDFLNLSGSVGTGTDQGGLVFNMDEVEEDKGFEILPKGNYNAVVDELDFGDSSTGNPMFTAKFKVTDGEFTGRVVFDYWVLGGKGAEFGLGKLKKFLTRICPDANMQQFNPQSFADEGSAIGREVTLSLKISTQKKGEYKGEKRNQVADILAASSGSFL
jgi:hypothetical protein